MHIVFRFPATTGLLYSQAIQLCQNCYVRDYNHVFGTVVDGVLTSEDCYAYLDTDSSVQMVTFDPLGICRAYTDSTYMYPPYRPSSNHGSWAARKAVDTSNLTKDRSLYVEIKNHICFLMFTNSFCRKRHAVSKNNFLPGVAKHSAILYGINV